jgi:TPR repeat protein
MQRHHQKTGQTMKFFQRALRAALVCSVMLAAQACSNDPASLTAQQADALQTKAVSGSKSALEKLTVAAQKGNVDAQFSLGILFAHISPADGKDIPESQAPLDYDQVARWLPKAAEQGHRRAQYYVGLFHYLGRGSISSFPQDYSKAELWLHKSAEQGDIDAQYYLGALHASPPESIGKHRPPPDYVQAAQWWREAAWQGHAYAQYKLGWLHLEGQGVAKSKAIPYALFSLAAAVNSGAADDLASLTKRMTQQEIEAGQTLTQRMRTPGNLLYALDEYLAQPAIR